MKKVISVLTALVVSSVLCTSSYAVTVSFVPTQQSVYPDNILALDLAVSGLGSSGPSSLGAFSLDVLFDTSFLNYDSVVFGQFLGNTDPLAFESDILVDDSNVMGDPGKLHLEQISFLTDMELDALQSFEFTLATLYFNAVSVGTTFVYPDSVILSDAFGFQLPDPILGRAEVQVLPLPPAFVMFVSGFMFFFALVRFQVMRLHPANNP